MNEDLPSNPYAGAAATAPRLEDKPGYPWATPWFRADLTDEAQLGPPPPPPPLLGPSVPPSDEPVFMLSASDPLSGMIVRFWANAMEKASPIEAVKARAFAASMDAWRARNSRAG